MSTPKTITGGDRNFYKIPIDNVFSNANITDLANMLTLIVTLPKKEAKETLREIRKLYPRELLQTSAGYLPSDNKAIISELVRELNNEKHN